VRRGPIAQDRGKFGVKLGECGAKRSLAGRVGATPEVAGDSKRNMRNKICDAEFPHRHAIRLLSRFARSAAGVPIGGAQD
jgi:hypothetical protein